MDQIYGHFLSLRAAKLPSEPFLEASASTRILAGWTEGRLEPSTVRHRNERIVPAG